MWVICRLSTYVCLSVCVSVGALTAKLNFYLGEEFHSYIMLTSSRRVWSGLAYRYSPYLQNRFIGIGDHSCRYISADMHYALRIDTYQGLEYRPIYRFNMINQYRHIGYR